VSRLDRGFIRPEYPEQVVFSYYQASLVLELVENRWGLDAILAMLEGFRDGKTNAQVFEEVLGESLTDFDEEFDDYVQQQWGDRMRAVSSRQEGEGVQILEPGSNGVETLRARVLENPGSFPARLAYGQALFKEDRLGEAEGEFRAALSLFPEYGGRDSPYLFLARIHKEQGDKERAARVLQQLGGLSETLYPAHLEEAELWLELGDLSAAARALEKAVEIVPFDIDSHRKLAGLYGELGEAKGAVLERRAILALDPVDKAEAHYLLAEALKDAGERAEAKTQVLRALEIAPNYEAALELLLELRREIL
jgi:tetratricopeptide (TPR) repeat protein